MALSVFGFGAVGQSLAKQAVHSGIRVLAVTDSSAAIISNNDSFNFKKLSQLCSFKDSQHNKLIDWTSNGSERVIPISELCDELPSDSVVADCSASNDTVRHLKYCQQRGIAVTMSNKRPLTGLMSDFNALTRDRSLIRFEATVGAGLPILTTMRRIIDSSDRIIQIEGQLSGTIGFMLSELTPNSKMSEIIKKAQKYHYTEPDIRDDLNGMDIARKALILSRCVGMNLDLNDIEIESLYPKEMDELPHDEFMQNLGILDEPMAKRAMNAALSGERLRYVASLDVENQRVKVGLIEVGAAHPLYHLHETDNMVSIKTEWYKDDNDASPLRITGTGSGSDVAAGAMLSDLYELKGGEIKKELGAQRKSF